MSDILEIAKFDAGVQTPSGYKQFSAVDTAGELIVNREYKESFDKFKAGCTCEDSYIWRALSAVADKTGLVLYDNVKNYIDYVTNVDICKVQALRSMVKMHGLEYKVFDRLDLLPIEILDLVNIFSINKKHLLYGDKLLAEYKQTLSAAGVIYDYGGGLDDTQVSAVLSSHVLDCDCLNGGNYRVFIEQSFYDILKRFLSLPYEDGGSPIYTLNGEYGIYEDLSRRRDKYTRQYTEGTEEYNRRQYKVLNGVSLRFDEAAVLDRIEAGEELESSYSGAELRLIEMEKEARQKSYSKDKTSRYAFYKKQRVLEYANFVVDKYFSDYSCSNLSSYDYDKNYFEVLFEQNTNTKDAAEIYISSGLNLLSTDQDGKLCLNDGIISSVAKSLADTSLYISRIREKIKLQTQKNYMKGTYDLMLYVINEFLVDYSRLNPIFRNISSDYEHTNKSVAELLQPIYQDLSSHDINNLTAIEYFDETEYYNIAAATDDRSNVVGTNDRFWRDPGGESLIKQDGIDQDFDIKSITSFYMDTLGIRDNYISDENSLCAFLDAVYSLGAMDSFIHDVSADVDGKESAHELFGAQVEKYGQYSDDLYEGYLDVKRAWATFNSYLSGHDYDYQVSDCVSAQVLSAADYIKQIILERELSSVSAVYDAYIDRVDQLSISIGQGVEAYNNLISGEYAFYFQKASGYKYCFDGSGTYKHQWYTNSRRDAGLEHWYDMIQAVDAYASGYDDGGDYITNWPIRDTVEYFYREFVKLSTWYLTMVGGHAVPDIGLTCANNWSTEYGFVDISAASLEEELKYGYDFMQTQIDQRRQYIITTLNGATSQATDLQIDESVIEQDPKILTYKEYVRAIIQLSSLYLPVKYEYDSISKDQKQRAYLSEFQPDTDMTLAALGRLSAYSVEKDASNKTTILNSISQMRQKYQEAISAYQEIADELEQEYMLSQRFQPYVGYIEEMVQLMYEALRTNIEDKTWHAYNVAEDEYLEKISPAAGKLIKKLAQYAGSLYKLPDAVTKRLAELYYFDEPAYIRQKEMFLTYGGRNFCYYPYYNFKNIVHSSYQVHPFLWNFTRREQAYNVVQKTFFSVNVDELERDNIASHWRKFFGDFGEPRYEDLSKPRYPDYSGYQSRYEDSNHIADNTQYVSEVVDYDGAFYPPAIEWIRANTIGKAIASIQDVKYSQKISKEICDGIYGLSSLDWSLYVKPLISANISAYYTTSFIDQLASYVYKLSSCYDNGSKAPSDVTPYEVCKAVTDALSCEDTFYGRFYRQLRLDQNKQKANKQYIIDQLSSYWGNTAVPGGGPSISAITNETTLDKAYDIYKYGIDSYGNMYCLYKKYDEELALSAVARGGLSYKYKQSTPGSLWIRLKDHPIAFPAFSGMYPNVYMESNEKRHVAFQNLLDLYKIDPATGEETPKTGGEVFPIDASRASCIYDFEFTKGRNDITFVTKMRTSRLTCDSSDIQCYENSWLVHCRPLQETLSSENGVGRTVLRLYSPSEETDYYQSGDNYRSCTRLSDESALDGDGTTLYQYIGSYLKGDNGIYHAYALKRVYRGDEDDLRLRTTDDPISCVVREVSDIGEIKIFPQVNGVYSGNPITGILADGSLRLVGPDICIAYDEEYNILNFAAQTVLASDTAVVADVGRIGLSSNADGATIDDPIGREMNSHDIFDTNVTLFRKQVVSRVLKDVHSSGNAKYEFNINADMSYFPVYPGFAGAKKLYRRPQYEHYSIELLGTAKDISQQISFVNPNPDPYLDRDAILSNFAHARVYQDFKGYIDETFKTVDNKLIGANSDVLAPVWNIKIDSQQQVVYKEGDFIVWQIGLNRLYSNISLEQMMKLKVLAFNKKCYGKNPYMFADISALAGGWVDLQYDAAEADTSEYSVISAADFIFGYNNRVVAQSTLDGMQMTGVSDSNHIYNVKSLHARFITDRASGAATLEFKFNVNDPDMSYYTYVPAGQIQVAFMDVRNLDMFNYFHYLDAYGVLRVIDNFQTMEEYNRSLTRRGPGYTIYCAGHRFTPEELAERLKSYYEYRGRMLPLSSVDLSQYDSLSDVYIVQGSNKLQFKVDEDFRYELDHPGYFYPTVNAKFPMNPAQYAMSMTSLKENAASDLLAGLFGQNNLFILDMDDPASLLQSMGRIDIPVMTDGVECIFAYEDYTDPAEEDLSARRNCDLYDVSDPHVLQFVQFEADAVYSRGVPKSMAASCQALVIPDSQISAVDMDTALSGILNYTSSIYGIDGVYPAFSETARSEYSQEYIGFTLDGGSLSHEQVEELSRIYVNYRKYEDDGAPKVQLYFNYMNYLDSPYLRIQDGRTYIDLIDNTYLSLKQDEDGILDVVTQFRYYKGGNLCGYRNVKLASYQIYNISDDKPKFLIKNVDKIERDEGSNKSVKPRVLARICDVELDAGSTGGENNNMTFDVMFVLETSMPLQKIEFYIDYPSDFMEFTSTSGENWTLDNRQTGYAKVIVDSSTRIISIPAKTIHTKRQLADMGNQSFALYIDQPVIVGTNGLFADINDRSGQIRVFVTQ